MEDCAHESFGIAALLNQGYKQAWVDRTFSQLIHYRNCCFHLRQLLDVGNLAQFLSNYTLLLDAAYFSDCLVVAQDGMLL